jgi:MYXO-CTERM domain-containing protein
MKRTRLILALLIVLTSPVLLSVNDKPSAGPYNVIAVAGRTQVGGWCECGTAGCICDPGETPGGNVVIQSDSESSKEPAPEAVDPGVLALLALFTLLLIRRCWI